MFTIRSTEFGQIKVERVESPEGEVFFFWDHQKASGGIDNPGSSVNRKELVQLIMKDVRACQFDKYVQQE